MANGLTVDSREWANTLRQYLPYVRRDLAYVLNKKGMVISARASRETAKANWSKAKSELRRMAYAIITKQRREKGKPLPTKDEWPEVVEAFLVARQRSMAWLKAGWIPAIQEFARAIGKTSTAKGLRAKHKVGGATPAKQSVSPRAELFNAAIATHGGTGAESALSEHAGKGLKIAMEKEMADMVRFVEREMQRRADQAARRMFR
jgi:hypothetical protein